MDVGTFMSQPLAIPLLLTLLGIAISGGMFVVPLYAFLTTFVDKSQTARTIAANNIVNSGAMVIGSILAIGLSLAGIPIVQQLLLSAAMWDPVIDASIANVSGKLEEGPQLSEAAAAALNSFIRMSRLQFLRVDKTVLAQGTQIGKLREPIEKLLEEGKGHAG